MTSTSGLRDFPVSAGIWFGLGIGGFFDGIGFGLFNVIEGLADHQIPGIHHVNETAPRSQWIYRDMGFLAWGAAMIVIGWLLLRAGRLQTQPAAT